MASQFSKLITEISSTTSPINFQKAYNMKIESPRLHYNFKENFYNIGLRLQECSIPFRKFETEKEYLTTFVKNVLPYENFTMSFLEMDDLSTYSCFEEWRGCMVNPAGYIYPKFLYADSMDIYLLKDGGDWDSEDSISSHFVLSDIMPTDIEDIKVGSGQNEVTIISVTFNCKKVTRVDGNLLLGDLGSSASILSRLS